MKSWLFVASLVVTFAIGAGTAETASAHEKWFVDSTPYPVDWLTGIGFPSNIGLLAALLLTALVAWVAKARHGREYIPGPEKLGATSDGRATFYGLVPLILGIHVGVPLIVFGIRGELFSPNNDLTPPWIYWLGLAEIGVGVSLLYGVLTRPAGLLLALLWVIGIGVRGPELMLENLYYLGFALFFALNGRGPWAVDRILFPALEPSPRLSALAMPSLRVATGLALVIVAFTEKLANPALATAFMNEFPLNFSSWAGMSVSDEVFIVGAGATELLIGLCVVFGYFPRLIIFTTWFFINLTLTIFNWVELLGHLPLYGVMAVFLVWSPRPEDARLWLRGVLGRERAAGLADPEPRPQLAQAERPGALAAPLAGTTTQAARQLSGLHPSSESARPRGSRAGLSGSPPRRHNRDRRPAREGGAVSAMENTLYDYSPLIRRPRLELPNGARLAFWIGYNVEHYEVDKPSTSLFPGTASLQPDPLNYGWRDYGPRVGVWRMMELLTRYGIRASVLLSSDVCQHYPAIIEEGNKQDWAWLAHGKNNSILQTGMTIDQERRYLADVVDTIAQGTGKSPKGWLGPALSETFNTPDLLAELGLTYICDWCNDDQPFPMKVKQGRMISVPYSIEVNDIVAFVTKGQTGEQFYQLIVDQFDTLYAEGAQSARVMCLALHPFVINLPFRQRYLERALDYITGHSDVWLATSDEIADWYYASYYEQALAGAADRS